MNPADILLRRPLGTGGPPGRRYYTTIDLKDFGNVGPLTQSKRPIRCTIQESKPFVEVSFLQLQAGNPTAVRLGYVVLWFDWVSVFILLSSI